MANYNLTKIILKKYLTLIDGISSVEKRVIEYYLNEDFKKILGSHIVRTEDCDLMTTFQDGFSNISIDTPFYDCIYVKIGNVNDSNIICAYAGDRVLFSIVDKEGNITNEVEYSNEDGVNILESLGVVLENSSTTEQPNIDAIEFSLSRKEDGEEIYEGSLTPILARAGSEEYFEFRNNNSNNEEMPSFIEKLIASLNSNAIVSVGTNNDTHKVVDYIDEVFVALDDKLQKTNAKKNTKKKNKKRVLENKKND